MKDINEQIKTLEEELNGINSKLESEELEFKKLKDEFNRNEQVMKIKSNLDDLRNNKNKLDGQIKALKFSNKKAGNYYLYRQDFIYLLNFNDLYFYYINIYNNRVAINEEYVDHYIGDLLDLTSCSTETQEFKDFKNDVEKFLNEIKKVI